ncbi:MAG: hypothetical protein ACLFNR_03425 [Candidatus Paceibacterota bacterium]
MRDIKVNKKLILMTVFLFILLLAVLLPVFLFSPEEEKSLVIEDREDWKVYENEEFSFSLEYPPDWQVVEVSDHPLVPSFHFLPPEADEDEASEGLTHHSDVANVSVFPEGYPTEGIFSQARDTSVSFSEEMKETEEYYLVNGEVWGIMADLSEEPEGWNEHGFIWSRMPIADHETLCFDGEEEINKEDCDPVLGHQIKHQGSVDPLEALVHEEVLQSFKLIE